MWGGKCQGDLGGTTGLLLHSWYHDVLLRCPSPRHPQNKGPSPPAATGAVSKQPQDKPLWEQPPLKEAALPVVTAFFWVAHIQGLIGKQV